MLLRRLVPWLALVGLSSVLAAGCGSDDGTTGSAGSPSTTGAPAADQVGVPQGPSTTAAAADTSSVPRTTAATAPSTPTTPAPAAVAPSTVAASPRERVIVDLAFSAAPPSAVETAQDEVIAALGDHGTLLRRLTATAQMSVSVDAEGRRILGRHPLVARVHADTADSSTSN